MAEAEKLQRQLIHAQNRDGGWGYQNSSSWTEPTAFALLALEAHNPAKNSAYERGHLWLQRSQRPDGGWAPNASVNISTWVTSLAVLALPQESMPAEQHGRAIRWLIRQVETEINPVERIVIRLQGVAPTVQTGGSPWFPGTAAWIGPSAMSILALSQASRNKQDPDLQSYVRGGQQYILCRRCRDGGWNHGGSRYLSENAASYPEMTGMALLALYGMPAAELEVSLKLAEARLEAPGSIEALSWLQLALVRHGRPTKSFQADLPCRTTRDVSLRLLASSPGSSNRLLTAIS